MAPTWDLVLLIFLGASLIYGFLMGKEKVVLTLLGAYVGLVVATATICADCECSD